MLVYLLGDVLRIFSGDYEKTSFAKAKMGQGMWFLVSVIMLIPIVMIMLSLVLPYSAARTVTIVAGIALFLFNAVGLPTYPSWYDRFLIVVGLGINVMSVVVAWTWQSVAA